MQTPLFFSDIPLRASVGSYAVGAEPTSVPAGSKMNGKLDPSELTGPVAWQVKTCFRIIDTNHDGLIETEEQQAALPLWQQSRNQSPP
jgi:hypothetical protein